MPIWSSSSPSTKSKGLEYPVVCLPFGTSFGRSAANTSGRQPACRWRAAAAGAGVDRRRPPRPTPNVCAKTCACSTWPLTRPRHALWVFGAQDRQRQSLPDPPERPGQPAGRAPANGCRRLGSQTASPGRRLRPHPPASRQRPHRLHRLQPQASAAALHPAQPYTAQFDRDWTVASYSRLTRDLKTQPSTGLSPMHTPRPADDERLPVGAQMRCPVRPSPPGVPRCRRLRMACCLRLFRSRLPRAWVGATSLQPIWHSFKARGTAVGNFLHDQPEWLAGERFALADNPALFTA